MSRMKFTTKLKRLIAKVWSAWKTIVDFAKANQLYITALFFVMTLFGIIAPDTSTSLRDAFVGSLL